MAESLIFGNQRIGARRGRARLRSRPRGCKLADVFTALALLLIAFIAFATGFEPQFNGPFAIACSSVPSPTARGVASDDADPAHATRPGALRPTSPSYRSWCKN